MKSNPPLKRPLIALAALACLLALAPATQADQRAFSQWSNWPQDENFFPLCVWLQNPTRANRYKAIGVNTYIGLWNGPTTTQLSQLSAAGLYAICSQNSTGLTSPYNDIIISWMLQDEPDNAQSNPSGGYYSPVAPYPNTSWANCPTTPISTQAAALKATDSTRPIMLNLGQGVAWDGWVGRGIRTNHPEDYPLYCASPDIASFDIYPGNSDRSATAKKYWLVAYGVDRLMDWTDQEDQAVFNCIEVSNIHGLWRPEPDKIKFEIWSSIIHGSLGLIYFCHEFEPFVEAGVLQYDDVCEMLTQENGLITQLAPIIKSPAAERPVSLFDSSSLTQVDHMVKQQGGYMYLFTANMRTYGCDITVQIPGMIFSPKVDVIGEDRQIDMVVPGVFTDHHNGYAVHIYRVAINRDGDCNGDGMVNIDDFVIFKQNYNTPSGATRAQGDFNGDGAVDVDDFILLKQNYNT